MLAELPEGEVSKIVRRWGLKPVTREYHQDSNSAEGGAKRREIARLCD